VWGQRRRRRMGKGGRSHDSSSVEIEVSTRDGVAASTTETPWAPLVAGCGITNGGEVVRGSNWLKRDGEDDVGYLKILICGTN
jgi:hypothetical protein